LNRERIEPNDRKERHSDTMLDMPKLSTKTALITGSVVISGVIAAAFISAKRERAEYESAQRAITAPNDCYVYSHQPLDELHADGTKTTRSPTSADQAAMYDLCMTGKR
jgi:hypothetical protein